MTTKITDANIDSNNLDNTNFNIGLLGFKMAVNEGLTIFNLVDGVVDEQAAIRTANPANRNTFLGIILILSP
jgi:hypothetical protein